MTLKTILATAAFATGAFADDKVKAATVHELLS